MYQVKMRRRYSVEQSLIHPWLQVTIIAKKNMKTIIRITKNTTNGFTSAPLPWNSFVHICNYQTCFLYFQRFLFCICRTIRHVCIQTFKFVHVYVYRTTRRGATCVSWRTGCRSGGSPTRAMTQDGRAMAGGWHHLRAPVFVSMLLEWERVSDRERKRGSERKRWRVKLKERKKKLSWRERPRDTFEKTKTQTHP